MKEPGVVVYRRRRRPHRWDSWALLTPPVVEVLVLAAAGRTNAAIAREVGVSVRAVEKRLARACEVLGAANTTAAVAVAVRRHLLPLRHYPANGSTLRKAS